jgi:hypothetical protein
MRLSERAKLTAAAAITAPGIESEQPEPEQPSLFG